MDDVLGSRPLPPPDAPAPAPDLSALSAKSVVLTKRTEREEQSVYDATKLLGLVSRATLKKAHDAQQKAISERQSEPPAESSEILHGYVEPPFDLDNLTQLLFQSWEYFAICDQLAIDVASGGYDLVDAEEPGEPASAVERGEVDYAQGRGGPDKLLRKVARDYIDRVCRDFFGGHITVADWGSRITWDLKATGNAYAEVLRGARAGAITGYLHVPSRLIRRHSQGRAYCQIDEAGREVAYFRRFGFLETKEEAPEIYFSPSEAAHLASRGKQILPGQLKPELLDFKIYHANSLHYGIPPIIAAISQVVGNIYSQNRNLRFFFNRGMPDYLITISADAAAFTDPLQGPLLQNFSDQVEEHLKFLQEGEDYRVLVLRLPTGQVEVKLEKLGTSIQDQEFAGYQADNSKAIVRVYRMLPQRLGIIETAQLGSGSGETQDETYKRAQIDPLQEMIEAPLNAALDSAGIVAIRVKLAEIDVLDEAREMALYTQAWGTKVLSINEGRAWVSRIVKDQDFTEDESDWANIPVQLLELQLAQLIAPGEGGVRPYAAGVRNLVQHLLMPKPATPPRPSDAEDQAAVGGRGRILDRARAARTALLGPGGQVPQPSAATANGFRNEAVRL